ncbi:hypothetical protein DHD32_10925 [Arenibacter sp. TNZ]|uniref:hypothetical protein n=1 Tax=Arenibacter TaxID=178469 RepID=UPI000CD43886|nr:MULTISPECIES: hypothetical protein [Arenibacter]MCM4171995.1 hypothetical protein [Arenibacter sp. TNZ]
MLGQKNTPEEVLTEFQKDTLWWKSIIGYKESEILFLYRVLNSKSFKEKPNLNEPLEKFKHELQTNTREVNNLKKTLNQYEVKLKGILECDTIRCETFYVENHQLFKDNFDKFYTDFNEFKTKVYNLTGGLL